MQEISEYLSSKVSKEYNELNASFREFIDLFEGSIYDWTALYNDYFVKIPKAFKYLKDYNMLLATPFELMCSLAFTMVKNHIKKDNYKKLINSKPKPNEVDIYTFKWFEKEDSNGFTALWHFCILLDSYYSVVVDFETIYDLMKMSLKSHDVDLKEFVEKLINLHCTE